MASPRPVEMAERLCGMANARGGAVIIGVEDAERRVVGVPEDRLALTVDVILRATRQIIKPALVLNSPEPEVYLVDGKQLLVASVPPNSGPIYQAGGVCWVWRGTYLVYFLYGSFDWSLVSPLWQVQLREATEAAIEVTSRAHTQMIETYHRVREGWEALLREENGFMCLS